jgi:cytochrome c
VRVRDIVVLAALAMHLLPASDAQAADCDAARGEQVFVKCAACHVADGSGTTLVGPDLHGVIGRKIASVAGFPYSPAMAAVSGGWSAEMLDRFIAAPMSLVPGTQMAFAGLRRPDDRRDLICYLQSAGSGP